MKHYPALSKRTFLLIVLYPLQKMNSGIHLYRRNPLWTPFAQIRNTIRRRMVKPFLAMLVGPVFCI